MEGTSRPMLLSPALPRLPGGLEPMPPTEPPLTDEEFAPRPSPLACKPLPPDVAAKIAAGQGMQAALEGWRRKSQLAWCTEQLRREEEAAAEAADAAAAQQQAERPAQAPGGPAAHAAASAAVSSNSGSGDEAGMPADALRRQNSRASAVLQGAPMDVELEEPADDAEMEAAEAAAEEQEAAAEQQEEEDDQLEAMLEQEFAGGGGSRAEEEEEDAAGTAGAAGDAAAAGVPAAEQAAAAEPAGPAAEPAGPTKPPSAAARRQRRAAARPQAAALAAALAAPVVAAAAAARATAAAAQPAAGAADVGSPAAVHRPSPAAGAAAAAAAAASPGGGFEAAGGWDDLGASSDGESGSEGEGGGQLGQGGKGGQGREPTLKERAVATALEKIGEPSWEAFCAKILERQAAAAAAHGGGGRGGRGRGRKGGRGKRKAGVPDSVESVQLATVLNKNSSIYHEAFAAAFREARQELDKLDTTKQRREKLKAYSKLVARWSELTVQEHEWYLAHQGQALTGSDAQRFSLLAAKVAEEQQQFFQDVQQKAAGGASAARYGHCTARQGAQLEQDAADRRQRQVQRLPRLYRLVSPLPVPEASPTAQAAALLAAAPQLQHLGTLRREGQPPAFALPAEPALINSSLRYLPCTMEGAAAGAADAAGAAGAAAAGRSGTAGGSGRGSGVPRVYSKQAVPPLAEDPLLPQLVQQAQQAAAASGAAAGGEGAEGQEAPPPPPPPPAEADAAAEGKPLFCVAASAFVALASTPMLRCAPAWEIPVTILAADDAADAPAGDGGGGGGSGTVVCLEKPLLQRLMSMRAKQQRLQKYAVLSMGLQHPAAESQQAQQVQQAQQTQEPTPRRRTRSSLAAAASAEGGDGEAPTAAAAAASSAPAGGTGLPHREAAYDSWQLGSCRLLVRSHGRLQLQQQDVQQQQEEQQQQQQAEPGGQGGQHMVLGLKTEYLPDPDREEHTMEELCAWWLKLLLRPGAASLLAAHVNVPHSRLLSSERLTADDIEGLCGGAACVRRLAAAGLSMLQGLLQELGRQKPGRYLLTHAPYEQQCCLFRAVPAEVMEHTQGPLPPLPCSPSSATAGTVYDLHAAHEHSGATDTSAIQFVPPRWRRFMPDIPQIPHTFPPRLALSRLGIKKGARKRLRKGQGGHLPFAWGVLGEGGDFDQVQHVGQISRADYLAGLQDELA